eukprot:gnl/Trimastix_PCT/1483.p1 GENE.gnl/Trimastix_PCT/1483~~gnl/Trimastix_PCT/1483.p1  ORF type:complete len:525 (-),score=157.52 gnl/Trimastix_PCT/1483:74-1648(-)
MRFTILLLILFVFSQARTEPLDPSTVITVIESIRDSKHRLDHGVPLTWKPDDLKRFPNTIYIDSTDQNQEIMGFGGAFTEAAAYNFAKMDTRLQEEILNAYYGPQGHGYTIGRVHINSCDFSLSSYNYDNVSGDYALRHFDMSHDRRQILPLVHRALQHTARARRHLRIFASPWSPPGWMKTNHQMVHTAKPGLLSDERVHAAWALYFSKFLTAYAREGVRLWGVTVQNEPLSVPCKWEGCYYSGAMERDFVRDHLGPRLRADHPEVQLMIFDHNKDHVYDFAKTVLDDARAAQYVDGVAFHWYSGDGFENLPRTHRLLQRAPSRGHFLLASEACTCHGVQWGNWTRFEAYAHDIIGDLRGHAVGWVDWNLVLDTRGGPNHRGNLCDAPVIVDTERQLVHYQPQYYAMGHFARYVRPGSVRVGSTLLGRDGTAYAELEPEEPAVPRAHSRVNRPPLVPYAGLEHVAFLSPEEDWSAEHPWVTVHVLNRDDVPHTYKLVDAVNRPGHAAYATIDAHAMQTLRYRI